MQQCVSLHKKKAALYPVPGLSQKGDFKFFGRHMAASWNPPFTISAHASAQLFILIRKADTRTLSKRPFSSCPVDTAAEHKREIYKDQGERE
jgi:hypothetical protein